MFIRATLHELCWLEGMTLNLEGQGHARCPFMAYMYRQSTNEWFGIGFISIGAAVRELSFFQNSTLRFANQCHNRGLIPCNIFVYIYSTSHLVVISSHFGAFVMELWLFNNLSLTFRRQGHYQGQVSVMFFMFWNNLINCFWFHINPLNA